MKKTIMTLVGFFLATSTAMAELPVITLKSPNVFQKVREIHLPAISDLSIRWDEPTGKVRLRFDYTGATPGSLPLVTQAESGKLMSCQVIRNVSANDLGDGSYEALCQPQKKMLFEVRVANDDLEDREAVSIFFDDPKIEITGDLCGPTNELEPKITSHYLYSDSLGNFAEGDIQSSKLVGRWQITSKPGAFYSTIISLEVSGFLDQEDYVSEKSFYEIDQRAACIINHSR